MKKFAIILAAGKGTRMKSDLPKVLHPVCGKPMVQYLIDSLERMNMDKIVVVIGHGAQEVRNQVHGNVQFVVQEEQLGTGHAVMQASTILGKEEGMTLVLTGDTPLIEEETFVALMKNHERSGAKGMVLTTNQSNPTGYGRIIRNEQGHVIGIVEEKDANEMQKKIQEINTGIFSFDNQTLFRSLPMLQSENAQNEYYLTDMVSIFLQQQSPFDGHVMENAEQMMGVNSRVQLAQAEKVMRRRINERHMINGVTLIDPENTYIQEGVVIGANTTVYPNVVLNGLTIIGENAIIESGTTISNSVIGNQTVVKQSVIADSHIGNDVQIGPFAHIRPSTVIQNKAKIGNFVELKQTMFGEGSKANHLSYIGNAEVGAGVNIGCGTITVNYDGKNKYKTTIEDGAFVGCNANLMAPVTIGEDSIVAAGSTVTKDVPKDALAISRTKQENKEGYASRLKSR